MNKTMIAAFAALTATATIAATSTPKGWTDDYDAALKQAAAEKKLVVADFSGSDWCGWCKKLDQEVFTQEKFLSAATNKYVLLMIDSPKDKKLLSEKAKTQNPHVVKKYKINGYPTVIILNEKGEALCRTGYRKGGPVVYLEHLERIIEQVNDPEYNEVIKKLEAKLEKTADAFNEAVHADVLRSYEKHLADLSKVLVEAKAIKVSDKNKEALEEVISPFEGMVESIEYSIKRSKQGNTDDDGEDED